MHYLTSRIRAHFPHWNHKPITENDCWEFIRRQKITVKQFPFAAKGYFGRTVKRSRKQYYIVLDSNLSGLQFLHVFLHEIGHAILHEPIGCRDVLYFRKENTTASKQDFEADVFALAAIVPRPLLAEPDIEIDRWILKERKNLFLTHRV